MVMMERKPIGFDAYTLTFKQNCKLFWALLGLPLGLRAVAASRSPEMIQHLECSMMFSPCSPYITSHNSQDILYGSPLLVITNPPALPKKTSQHKILQGMFIRGFIRVRSCGLSLW